MPVSTKKCPAPLLRFYTSHKNPNVSSHGKNDARKRHFYPEIMTPAEEISEFRGKAYKTDDIFEYHGFSTKAWLNCLQKPSVNIELSYNY